MRRATARGKLGLQRSHHMHGGIAGIAHREQDLEFGMVLREKTAKVDRQTFVDSRQRFQHADGLQSFGRRDALRKIIARGDHDQYAVDQRPGQQASRDHRQRQHLFRPRFAVDQLADFGQEVIHWLRALIAVLAVADRDALVLGLAIAHHQHVGNLLQLRVANFEVDFLVAVVERHAECRPASRRLVTFCAYSMWRSVIGSTMACTGASQTGNAPA